MYKRQAGKVGIGTNNPLKQLHVFKSNEHPVMFERGDTSNTIVELKTNGATRGYWGCSTTANFMVYDNDASDINFIVNQTGDIGMGVASPSARLHVSGGNGLLVERSAGTSIAGFKHTGASAMNIYFQNTGSSNHPSIGSDNQDLTLGTNNTERLRIKSNGNIGIGENDPQTKLQIAGSLCLSLIPI